MGKRWVHLRLFSCCDWVREIISPINKTPWSNQYPAQGIFCFFRVDFLFPSECFAHRQKNSFVPVHDESGWIWDAGRPPRDLIFSEFFLHPGKCPSGEFNLCHLLRFGPAFWVKGDNLYPSDFAGADDGHHKLNVPVGWRKYQGWVWWSKQAIFS